MHAHLYDAEHAELLEAFSGACCGHSLLLPVTSALSRVLPHLAWHHGELPHPSEHNCASHGCCMPCALGSHAGHESWVLSVTPHPSGTAFATGSSDSKASGGSMTEAGVWPCSCPGLRLYLALARPCHKQTAHLVAAGQALGPPDTHVRTGGCSRSRMRLRATPAQRPPCLQRSRRWRSPRWSTAAVACHACLSGITHLACPASCPPPFPLFCRQSVSTATRCGACGSAQMAPASPPFRTTAPSACLTLRPELLAAAEVEADSCTCNIGVAEPCIGMKGAARRAAR